MLISFRVANYRSFGDEQTLSMIASPRLTEHPSHCVPLAATDQRLLRNAMIYGANAAGKSNLVSAMRFAQNRILDNDAERTTVAQFRFANPDEAHQPTTFEFRFVEAETVFTYGFDLNGRIVASEWLDVGENSDSLFSRNSEGRVQVGKAFGQHLDALDSINALLTLGTRPEQLFLTKIIDLSPKARGTLLDRVVHWMSQRLKIVMPNEAVRPVYRALADTGFAEWAARYLSAVGTGVSGLQLVEEEFSQPTELVSDIKELLRKGGSESRRNEMPFKVSNDGRLLFIRPLATHQVDGIHYTLGLSDESDGTRRLLDLLPALYDRRDEPGVTVLDEFDRSLHPLLSWEFVKNFNDLHAGECTQLIVTTHDTHLMHHDLLRRDEVFFVEKDEKQQSRISSLSEFNVRKDLRLEKGYLLGRFGGIPHIHEPAAECETSAVGD